MLWQLTRAANHSPDYFVRVLLQFATVPVAVLGLAGLVVLLARHTERDLIVLLWAVPAFVYYTLWPTKLFPYLFPIVGAFCIAARSRRSSRRSSGSAARDGVASGWPAWPW